MSEGTLLGLQMFGSVLELKWDRLLNSVMYHSGSRSPLVLGGHADRVSFVVTEKRLFVDQTI